MAEALDRIYDALLLDHIRSARNYGIEPTGPALLEIANPLCGDVLQLQAWLAGEQVAQLRFSCECCGIAMGNASLMTETVRGLDRQQARRLAHDALAVLTGSLAQASDAHTAQAWPLLAAVATGLPTRRTCASLGWQALIALLDGHTSCTAREIRG